MKCYLHGPRKGQTTVINGVQFIDGVTDMPKLHPYFERYYNVKDYPPQEIIVNDLLGDKVSLGKEASGNRLEFDGKSLKLIKEEQLPEPSDEDILRQVVEAKKATIESKNATPIEEKEKTLVEQYLAIQNQGKRVNFVKELTGKILRKKEEAIACLDQLDKEREGKI